MDDDGAWFQAFETHLLHVRRASYSPPVVLHGSLMDTVLVVLPPWRYSTEAFAHDVRAQLHYSPTILAVPPPFEHPEGGREWWAYKDSSGSDDLSLMSKLQLQANETELVASLAAIRALVDTLASSPHTAVDLCGSSQGATVAAHVGVASSMVRRVAAFQPAGLYTMYWQPHTNVQLNVSEEAEAAHGDFWLWRGRMGRSRPNKTVVTLFVGRRDTVAPPELLYLV